MHTKHFIVHGHFYQPPRVDPFSNQIPDEFGAHPYGNWTEKIYHQCYLPNTNLCNFEKISFNIGPTLFAWLDQHHPETIQAIVDQERLVMQRTGISNAMAQPYFHLIMPLASQRDKDTMVRWGIRDYETRFGRKPEGMWLPETAVDLESLATLKAHSIQYTILAPWQAKDPALDITQPYRVKLPGGVDIVVFFYNRFLSSEISFNPSATENADRYVRDWLLPQTETLKQDKAQLFLAASDGELYGHHRAHRDQFLGHLIDGAVESVGIERIYPSLWLKNHPVDSFAEINENTSWSCHHGIERWRDVCGDAPTATWKKPLRDFLDHLAENIDQVYESRLDGLIRDPWKLRDEYADVLLGLESVEGLINKHDSTQMEKGKKSQVKLLVQAQYERLRMLSSDAWFFYDLDRIEPLNALKYAAHAVYLVERAVEADPSDEIIPIISQAKSELSGLTGELAFLGYLKKFEKMGAQDFP